LVEREIGVVFEDSVVAHERRAPIVDVETRVLPISGVWRVTIAAQSAGTEASLMQAHVLT